MANVKISGLTAASAVAGANEFEINEAGTSKKVTGTQLASYVRSTLDGDKGDITVSSGGDVFTIDALSVTSGKLAAGSATLAKLDTTGTLNYVLTAQGAGNAPIWQVAASSLGGATETTTSSDVTLTSSSNRVQKVTQTGTGKAFNLPDATTFSAPGSPIFNLGAVTGSPMFIKYSDGYRVNSVTTTNGAQISLSNISNAQTGYAINNTYPVTKNTDESVVASVIGSNAAANGLGNACNVSADQIDTNKFIVGYTNSANTTAYVVIATQSGNTFSFGTPLALSNLTATAAYIQVVGLSTTTAFVMYTTSSGNTQVNGLSISGTTITASTLANVSTNAGALYKSYKISSTTALLIYEPSTTTTGFRIATHNGASAPTFGTQVTIGRNYTSLVTSLLSTSKFVIGYTNARTVLSTCATISGTTITLGTELTIGSTANSNGSNAYMIGVLPYSATEVSYVIRASNENIVYTAYATISGTTLTLGNFSLTASKIKNGLIPLSATTGNTLMNDDTLITYSGSGSFGFKQSSTYTGQNNPSGIGSLISGSSTSYLNFGTQFATDYPALWITAQVA